MLYSFTTTIPTGDHEFEYGECKHCSLSDSSWGGEWCPIKIAVVTVTSDTALGLLLSKPKEAHFWVDGAVPEMKNSDDILDSAKILEHILNPKTKD
jgi:hypothetical protein